MSTRGWRGVMALITLLALALRLIPDGANGLWLDESSSVLAALRPGPVQTLAAAVVHDFHPPLFDLLLWAWLKLSHDPRLMRLLPVLFGTFAATLAGVLARRMWDARAGIFAAALMAVAPWQVYYSRELRMYGLETLLAAAGLLTLLRALERRRPRDWALHALVSVAFLYSDFFAVGAVVGQAVWIFALARVEREQRRRALVSYGLIALGALSLTPVAMSAVFQGAGSGALFSLPRLATYLADAGAGWGAPTPVAAVAVLAMLLALTAAIPMLRGELGARLLWLHAGAPVTLMALLGALSATWVERGIVFTLPALAVLLGGALSAATHAMVQRTARLAPYAAALPAIGALLLVTEIAGLAALYSNPLVRLPSAGAYEFTASHATAGFLHEDQVTATPFVTRDQLAGRNIDQREASSAARPTLALFQSRLHRFPAVSPLLPLAIDAYSLSDLDTSAWRIPFAQVPAWCSALPGFWLVYQGRPIGHDLGPQLGFDQRFNAFEPGVDTQLARIISLIPATYRVDGMAEVDSTYFWHYGRTQAAGGA